MKLSCLEMQAPRVFSPKARPKVDRGNTPPYPPKYTWHRLQLFSSAVSLLLCHVISLWRYKHCAVAWHPYLLVMEVNTKCLYQDCVSCLYAANELVWHAAEERTLALSERPSVRRACYLIARKFFNTGFLVNGQFPADACIAIVFLYIVSESELFILVSTCWNLLRGEYAFPGVCAANCCCK